VGVISIIIWLMTLLVSVKYCIWVLKADNKGEGGTFALMTLLSDARNAPAYVKRVAVPITLISAAFFIGGAMLTPAISVLSAVEGLVLQSSAFHQHVVWVSCVILLALFASQSAGTGRLGNFFGPIMVLYFSTIGLIGLYNVTSEPTIFRALNPGEMFAFFHRHGSRGFQNLGFLLLCVTGVESMYADMGHFGRRAVTQTWITFVYPSLVLQYLGQGAVLLKHPEYADDAFYRSVPSVLFWPVFLLAVCATVIASQSNLSGTFTLLSQAVNLGFMPRMQVIHTDLHVYGRVYLPGANFVLMVATICLTVWFGTSAALATAFGTTVCCIMLLTTVLMIFVVRYAWNWSVWTASAFAAFFLLIDGCLAGASLFKVAAGGWLPLMFGIMLALVMNNFRNGNRQLGAKVFECASNWLGCDLHDASFEKQADAFSRLTHECNIKALSGTNTTSIFLCESADAVPFTLLELVHRARFIPEKIILVHVQMVAEPVINSADRVTFLPATADGVFERVVLQVGFAESRSQHLHTLITRALFGRMGVRRGKSSRPRIIYYIGRKSVIVHRERNFIVRAWLLLFDFLRRNARSPHKHFGLPTEAVLEIGCEVTI